jgi:adenylosuccinate lyase
MDRLATDPAFAKIDLATLISPTQFIGRAPQQVDEFLAQVVEPIRARYADQWAAEAEIHV